MKYALRATGRSSVLCSTFDIHPDTALQSFAFQYSLSSPSLSVEPPRTQLRDTQFTDTSISYLQNMSLSSLVVLSLKFTHKTCACQARCRAGFSQFSKQVQTLTAQRLGGSSFSEAHAIMFQHLPPSFDHVFYQVTDLHSSDSFI